MLEPETWGRIVHNYQIFNPHLSLAHLASGNLTGLELEEIHDRLEEAQREVGEFVV